MNSDPHNPIAETLHNGSGEETLRLIARLPAPQGLEERLHRALREAPRNGRVLTWPARIRSRVSLRSGSMRAAAAAAIVFVVVGGGWGVYSRVAQVQSGNVITMPARMPASGRFAGAGAIRTPATLPGPKIAEKGSKGTQEQEIKPAHTPSKQQNAQGITPRASQSAASKHARSEHPATEPALRPAIAR